MTIKLAGRLPKNDDRNGLGELLREFVQDPYKSHIAVVVLETGRITRDLETEDVIPTVRVVAIEPITGGVDVGKLRAMLQRAHEQRTGNLELPADWEHVLAGLPDSNGVVGGGS